MELLINSAYFPWGVYQEITRHMNMTPYKIDLLNYPLK